MAKGRREDTEQRKAEIMRLRRQGQTFEAIGDQLGITRQRAHQIYTTTLNEIPAQQVTEYRAEQAERLDELLRKAHEVLAHEHVTVSQGRVVRMGRPFINDDGYADVDENRGEVVKDDAPTLMAIKTILQIEERRAKLFGLDTPIVQKVAGDLTVTYSFEGVSLDELR